MSDQWGQQPQDPQQPQQPQDPQQQPPPAAYPQQGYPQPGYQGYPPSAPPVQPGAGYGAGHPMARPPIPPPVSLAVKLMYVGALLSVLGIFVQFLLQDDLRAMFEDQPNMTPELVDTAMGVGLGVGVVFGLLAAGLWVLNAVFNARGRNWARILSTVLAGLNVVSTLLGLLQPSPALSRVLSLLGLVLAAAILVLLWRPGNKAFYASGPPRY